MRRANGPLDRGERSGLSSGQYDVELTLELARGAREPSLADKQRVLASLRDRLGSMPSWPPAEHDITGVRRTLPEAARGPAGPLTRLFGSGVKATVALQRLALIGAVTGGLGFWLGSHDGDGAPLAQAPSAIGPASASASASPAAASPGMSRLAPRNAFERCDATGLSRSWGTPPDGESPLLASPSAPGVLEVLAPSWAAPPRQELSPATVVPSVVDSPARRGQLAPTAPGEPLARPVSPADAPEPSSAEQTSDLTRPRARRERTVEERAAQNGGEQPRGARARAGAAKLERAPFLEAVRLLQRAQRAVDASEPALAMFLLGELDTRFPRELLGEERAATRVLALCESGQTDRAHQVARELNLQSPSSIYAARIARSCVSLADNHTGPLVRERVSP